MAMCHHIHSHKQCLFAWRLGRMHFDRCGAPLQGYSPVLGRAAQSAGSQQEGVPALKRLWLSTVPVTNTLAVMTRVVRLLYHVVNGTISRPRTFQQRAQLRHSVLPALLEPGKAPLPATLVASGRTAGLPLLLIRYLCPNQQESLLSQKSPTKATGGFSIANLGDPATQKQQDTRILICKSQCQVLNRGY